MRNKAFSIIFFSFLFLATATIMIWAVQVGKRGNIACQKIGAEYRWGRDFSVCVKPDGSVWRMP